VIYVLDAGPMIALLANEPGADVTESALTEPGSACYAHVFNLAEIYYIYHRRGGVTAAESALQDLLDAGVIARNDADTAFWKNPQTPRGIQAIAFPAEFSLGLAGVLKGTAVTADHNDFDRFVAFGLGPIRFTR